MRLVVGNKQKELTNEELNKIISTYSSVVVDIGTGDGRFVYKNGLINCNVLYIGVDPSEKQLRVYSKKALKRKVNNVLFIVGSMEQMPIIANNSVNKIYITLPWGTLLESIVKPKKDFVLKIFNLLKKDGKLITTFGYTPELEPSESKRLNLPPMEEELVIKTIIPSFESYGFTLDDYKKLSKKDLRDTETTWAKRLRFGKDRKIYCVSFWKKL